MQKKSRLIGLREYEFVKVLNAFFDEDYVQELMQSEIEAEFVRTKDGVYHGKVKTAMHKFYLTFRFQRDGEVEILRYSLK